MYTISFLTEIEFFVIYNKGNKDTHFSVSFPIMFRGVRDWIRRIYLSTVIIEVV